jgi:hypothetical protein
MPAFDGIILDNQLTVRSLCRHTSVFITTLAIGKISLSAFDALDEAASSRLKVRPSVAFSNQSDEVALPMATELGRKPSVTQGRDACQKKPTDPMA